MSRTEIRTLLEAVAAYGLPGSLIEPPARPLGDHSWQELLFRVRGQRMTGLLAQAVSKGAIPATDVQITQAVELHSRALVTTLMLEATLLEVTESLQEASIPFVVLKGPAVAHLDYPDPALREFGDVDLLIRPQDLDHAIAELGKHGCTRRFPEPRRGFDRRFTKSVSVVTPNGVEIDLHRTFAPGPFGLRIDLEELWRTPRVRFQLAGRTLEALAPEERLIHACYHAVLGDVPPRLVPQRDIAQMLLFGTVDAGRVRALTASWQGQAVIAHAVKTTWATLQLADVVALSAWAARFVPTARDEREVQAATSPDNTYATQAVASLRAIRGLRGRLAYASALAFPRRAYLEGRHSGFARRMKQAAAEVLRSTPTEAAPADSKRSRSS